jgi:hypothetical protein
MNLLDLRGQRHTPFSRSGKILARLIQQNLNLAEQLRDANVNRKGHAEGLMTEWEREGARAVKRLADGR